MMKLIFGMCLVMAAMCQGAEPDDDNIILDRANDLRYNMPEYLALVKQYPILRQERITRLSPIIYTVALRDSSQIPAFLEAVVPINQCDDRGKTPLMLSV